MASSINTEVLGKAVFLLPIWQSNGRFARGEANNVEGPLENDIPEWQREERLSWRHVVD